MARTSFSVIVNMKGYSQTVHSIRDNYVVRCTFFTTASESSIVSTTGTLPLIHIPFFLEAAILSRILSPF
jgi:hypothetical protein